MNVFVSIRQAMTHLSRLLGQVAARERVLISKSGHPIAELVQQRRPPIVVGGLRGRLHYSDADWETFDAEIADMFYGPDAAP